MFSIFCLSSALKTEWWMVEAHIGTVAQPYLPAPAGKRTTTGVNSESLSIGGKEQLRSFLLHENSRFFSLNVILWSIHQRAHLWWLHYDVCWWMCDIHALHLPPLFFICFSCRANKADTFRKKVLNGHMEVKLQNFRIVLNQTSQFIPKV